MLKHLLCISILLISTWGSAAPEQRIIGYSMNPGATMVREHSAKYVTDIIFFSVEPNADGTIDQRNLSASGLEAIPELRDKHGVQLHLAVGGWGRCTHFAAVSATAESRAKFIAELMTLCQKHGFSGIDYDWEFPKDAKENALFADLLVESKAAFQPHDIVLSAALSPWQKLDPIVYTALDRVHLMTYDFAGRHATLGSTTLAAENFIKQGIPPENLYLGVPFYGRGIVDRDKTMGYKGIIAKHNLDPHQDEIDGMYFNGPVTIEEKARYTKERGLGGIMIWELSQDITGRHALLRSIHRTLR